VLARCLARPRREEDAAEALDLVEVVDLRRIELLLKRVELVGLGTLADLGDLVGGLERAVDLFRALDEVFAPMVFGLSGTGVRLAAEKVFAFSGMRTCTAQEPEGTPAAAAQARLDPVPATISAAC